jgi:hypothetical protein
MASVEQISEWLGQKVVDADGEPLGKLEDVYYERTRGEPELALVKSGLFGRKHTIVPLHGATVGREHVRIAYGSEQISQAADAAELDPGETLVGERAQQLGAAYGLQLAGGDLDSGNALAERRAAADGAEERAGELEAEAHERSQVADDAQARAREQSAQAAEAEKAAREAREEASRLRP